ncbi:flagellar hook-basal body complex protein [Curvivirga aplysinae]|uniref:flagellar hook-basal body complex protein n=1 Tax=Curvivirga aplysinae TaxID=2529852 RepID=UPI0012BD5A62|nr:flagellar hook-basal body complex protein [Curvivirga aplysinae]MTI09371.1 flagellar hook-basal body complex protein [Curvivirga aplysinae]
MVSDYSFTSGITAMRAHSRSLAAIADNVANLNTAGFKHTQIHTQSLTNESRYGSVYGNYSGTSGVVFNRYAAEGTTISTQSPLDGALMGKGFFITSDALTGGQNYLTAAGQFDIQLEQDGSGASYIKDGSGNYLLGWDYNPATSTFNTGNDLASVGPIRADRFSTTYAAVATSEVSVGANLSADTAVGESQTISFGVLDGSGDADGINDGQNINMVFTKSATPNIWDVTITGDGGTVSNTPFQVEFDSTGSQMSIVGSTSTSLNVSVNWANSGASNTFSLNLGNFTQFAGANTLDDINTNGFSEGVLGSTYFGDEGIVYGKFTNGATRPVAKVAIGDVRNAEGLNAVSGTHFETTGQSGEITVYDPEVTTRARFVAGAYEGASTNLNAEFSNMITTQRAYSSAATTIRTADEMMQTVSRLK